MNFITSATTHTVYGGSLESEVYQDGGNLVFGYRLLGADDGLTLNFAFQKDPGEVYVGTADPIFGEITKGEEWTFLHSQATAYTVGKAFQGGTEIASNVLTPIPEPGSAALVAVVLVAVALVRRLR